MICVSFSHVVEHQLPFCDVLAISWVHFCIPFELGFEVRKNGALKNSKSRLDTTYHLLNGHDGLAA